MELEFDPLFQCCRVTDRNLCDMSIKSCYISLYRYMYLVSLTLGILFCSLYMLFWDDRRLQTDRQFALKNYYAILVVYICICTSLFNNGEYIQLVCSSPPVVLFMTFFRKMSQLSNFLRGCCLFAPSVHFKMEGIYV